MNSVNLIDRLTADPQMKYFESGKTIAKFYLAVNRTKDETDFFEMEAWEKTAEVVGQYCKKGSQVGVSGRLLQECWPDKTTGANRSKVVVRCQRVELLGSKKDEQSPNDTTTPMPPHVPVQTQRPQARTQVIPPTAVHAAVGPVATGDDDIPF